APVPDDARLAGSARVRRRRRRGGAAVARGPRHAAVGLGGGAGARDDGDVGDVARRPLGESIRGRVGGAAAQAAVRGDAQPGVGAGGGAAQPARRRARGGSRSRHGGPALDQRRDVREPPQGGAALRPVGGAAPRRRLRGQRVAHRGARLRAGPGRLRVAVGHRAVRAHLRQRAHAGAAAQLRGARALDPGAPGAVHARPAVHGRDLPQGAHVLAGRRGGALPGRLQPRAVRGGERARVRVARLRARGLLAGGRDLPRRRRRGAPAVRERGGGLLDVEQPERRGDQGAAGDPPGHRARARARGQIGRASC
ncbi:MAG: hypothetical protein AVDCRST_MAG11-3423, partial [uncultured Gemmatimonadaceae bacterium]